VVVLNEILRIGKRNQDSAVPRDFNKIKISIHEGTGEKKHDTPTKC
jgi:hypothetical protein